MKLLHICLIITSIFLQSSNCTLKDDRRFDLWKKQFGKNYKSSLYEDKAKAKFYQNLQKIDEHNQRFENGLETYRRGTWDRSDMSYEEKKSTLTSGTSINNTLIFESANTSHNSNLLAEPSSNPPRAYLKTKQSPSKPNLRQSGAPTSLDWTALGRVHSVVDQGKCGGCYAFATVGTLEGVALKNNVQNRFSVQQIIDCNKSTFGCNGGDPAASLKYAVSSGLASSSDYPFKMKKGKCENFQKTKAFSKSYTTVLNGNEQKLMETVAKYGPVTGGNDYILYFNLIYFSNF